jgi:trigger factor
VKAELENEAERLAEEKTKAGLLEKIIQKTNLEIPESLIGTEVDRLLYEIASAYRIDLKKLQKNDAQFAEYREKLKPRAVRNLKQEMVLSEISRKENIQLAEEELDEEIRAYAQRTKKNFTAVKNSMAENKSIDGLRYRLRLNKALEFLYKNARLEKVKKLKYEQDSEGGNT